LEARESAQAMHDEELKMESAAIRTQLIILKDPKIKKTENREKFEQTVVGLLQDVQPEKLSTKAKRDFYYTQTAYYGYIGDWDAAHTAAKNLIKTYPDNDKEISKEHKRHLCRYLIVAHCANNYDTHLEIIDRLKLSASQDDISMLNTIYFNTLLYYLNNYEIESAIKIAENIELRWEELSAVIEKRRQLAFCSNMMVAYWFGGSMDTAIHWLSKILNAENVLQGQRFINNARIIQLPMYYDYEDNNLDNRIESTRKVLTKKGELGEYRQIILTGFRKLIRCANKQEKKTCIANLQHKLTEIKQTQNLNTADLECVLFWCERKL